MKVFELNGRPFLLKEDVLSTRKKKIYELLTKDDDCNLLYPYQIETKSGEKITVWRSLSTEEVRDLLDKSDKRPLVDTIYWNEKLVHFVHEYGKDVTVKQIALVAHKPFVYSMVDGNMSVTCCRTMLSLEDYSSLIQFVMNDVENYDIRQLQEIRPDLYQRLIAHCPHPLQPSTMIFLYDAEKIVSQLLDFGTDGDEICSEEKDDVLTHIVAQVCEDSILMMEESVENNDIDNKMGLLIEEICSFMSFFGVHTSAGIMRIIYMMYQGKKVSLSTLANFMDEHKLKYKLISEKE